MTVTHPVITEPRHIMICQ